MTDMTFEMSYQVPIHDINFGGHLGHVEWLHILHEARVRFLHQYGQSETDFYGIALVMRHVGVTYRQQAHWGDHLHIALTVKQEKARLCFDYVVRKAGESSSALTAKMDMVAIDLERQTIVRPPLITPRGALTTH